MKKFNTFMAYSLDEYELPCAVFNTAEELAQWLDCSVQYLYFALQFNLPCRGYGVWCGVVV